MMGFPLSVKKKKKSLTNLSLPLSMAKEEALFTGHDVGTRSDSDMPVLKVKGFRWSENILICAISFIVLLCACVLNVCGTR